MNAQLNIARRLAVENLQESGGLADEQQLGRALLQALVRSGVDLRHGPSLEEMKQLLLEVCQAVRREERLLQQV
jgi:hypothetical protein